MPTTAQRIQRRAETIYNRHMETTGTFDGFSPDEWAWILKPQNSIPAESIITGASQY